jgi:hypothetical protein
MTSRILVWWRRVFPCRHAVRYREQRWNNDAQRRIVGTACQQCGDWQPLVPRSSHELRRMPPRLPEPHANAQVPHE